MLKLHIKTGHLIILETLFNKTKQACHVLHIETKAIDIKIFKNAFEYGVTVLK